MNAGAKYIVEVTAEERSAGQLAQDSAKRAYSAMNTLGFVILRGCFAPDLVTEMHAEYLAQYGHLDVAGMEELSRNPSPTIEVGKGRFEIVMKLVGAFDMRAYANGLLLRFLIPLMGQDLRLSGVSAVADAGGEPSDGGGIAPLYGAVPADAAMDTGGGGLRYGAPPAPSGWV